MGAGIAVLAGWIAASAQAQIPMTVSAPSRQADAGISSKLNGPRTAAFNIERTPVNGPWDENVFTPWPNAGEMITPVSVPEAPTLIAALLLLLPFGACALRIIRRQRPG